MGSHMSSSSLAFLTVAESAACTSIEVEQGLDGKGVAGDLQLRELLNRVRDSNDLEKCLKAITLARQRRASFGEHQNFSPQLGGCLAKVGSGICSTRVARSARGLHGIFHPKMQVSFSQIWAS